MVECISKNGNLLLNVGPDAKGEMTRESLVILDEVGEWMRLNGDSIYGCGKSLLPKPEWGRYTQRAINCMRMSTTVELARSISKA